MNFFLEKVMWKRLKMNQRRKSKRTRLINSGNLKDGDIDFCIKFIL